MCIVTQVNDSWYRNHIFKKIGRWVLTGCCAILFDLHPHFQHQGLFQLPLYHERTNFWFHGVGRQCKQFHEQMFCKLLNDHISICSSHLLLHIGTHLASCSSFIHLTFFFQLALLFPWGLFLVSHCSASAAFLCSVSALSLSPFSMTTGLGLEYSFSTMPLLDVADFLPFPLAISSAGYPHNGWSFKNWKKKISLWDGSV